MAKKWKKAIWGTVATVAISAAVVCAAVSCGSNSSSNNNNQSSSTSSTTNNQIMSNSLIAASIANQLTNKTGIISAKGISTGLIPTTYITDSKQAQTVAWNNYFATKAPNGYVASLTGYQPVTVPTDEVTFSVISTNYQNDSLKLELNYKNAGATITVENVPQTSLPAQMVVNQLANSLAGTNLTIDASNISALKGLSITSSQSTLSSAIFDYLQSQIPSQGLTFSGSGYNAVTINSQNLMTATNPNGNLIFNVGSANMNNDTVPVTITYDGANSNITISNISQQATSSAYILKQVVDNITNNTNSLNVANINSLQSAYLTNSLSSLTQAYNAYFQSLFSTKSFQEPGYGAVSVNSTDITYTVTGVSLTNDILTITASYNGANKTFTVTNVPQTKQSQNAIISDIINTLTNNAGSLQAMNIPELASYNLGSPTVEINNAITEYLNSQFGTKGFTYSETGFLPTTVNSTNVSYSYAYDYPTNSITVTVTYGNATGTFTIENIANASFSNAEIANFIASKILNGATSLNASTVSYLTSINMATPNITSAIKQAIESQFTTTGWVLQKQGYTSITINKSSITNGMVVISVAPVSGQSANVTITYNGSAATMIQITNIPYANFSKQMIANDLAHKLSNSTSNTIAYSSITDWKNDTMSNANSFLTYFTDQFTSTGWTFSQTGYNSITINNQSLTNGQVSLTAQPVFASNSIDVIVNYQGSKATITITGVPSAIFSDLTIANDIKNELTNDNSNGLDLPNVSYLKSFNLQTQNLTSQLTKALEGQFTTKGWIFSEPGYTPVTITSSNLTSSTNPVSIMVANPVGGNCTVTITYGTAKTTFQIMNIPNSNMTIVTYLKDNYLDKLSNNTLDISNLSFPTQSDAKMFSGAQVINSKHQKYYTTLIFEQYLAYLGVKSITVNDVQYTVASIANDLSSMIPSTISQVDFNAGIIPNVTLQYNDTTIGTITITGFAKPTTNDLDMQDSAIVSQLKSYLDKLSNQTLDIANWKFPSNANATSFNALQVLHSNQLNYYTLVVFKTYFANNNITTITANGVIYSIESIASQISTMLPSTITATDYSNGTVSGITLNYASMKVGMLNITGFAKPTTNDMDMQNSAIINQIKNDIGSLNGTLNISNLSFPSDSNAKAFNVEQVLTSTHQKYYTSLIFNQYFASKKMTTMTVNDVVYQISNLANNMSSMLPSTVSQVDYEAGTIPSVTVKYDGTDVGTLNITGFAKPTTFDINAQNSAIASQIKQVISSLDGTLNISNLTFPTDSNAKAFNVEQVLTSSHQKYYTSLIFSEYFVSKKMTTMTVNHVVYQISDLANAMSSMLPSTVTATNYEAGTIPGVTVKYSGMDVGTLNITGFAKPTTSDINNQNSAIVSQIKQDITNLKGTLDISSLTFPTDSNAKAFNVEQVLTSAHQKYYTSLIFSEYFSSMKMSTLTANHIVYEISNLANDMSSVLPNTVSATNYEAGTIPGVTVEYNGMDVGMLNITGFAKPTTTDIASQNSIIASQIKQDIANLKGTLDISSLTFPSDSNAKSFNVEQVLTSAHQKYYTSLIFNEYFSNMKMSTLTANHIVYEISNLANDMSSMLPDTVSATNYEAGTIPGVTVQYNGTDVGILNITGFAKPTTTDLASQNSTIASQIKQDITNLKGTLDIANLTFPSNSNAKAFNVEQVLTSTHQKYYTSLIFNEYFSSMKMSTLTANHIVYEISDLANDMSSMLPNTVTATNYEAGTIPGVTVKYSGMDVGTINITGFAKPTTSDLASQNSMIANDIKEEISSLDGTLNIKNLTFPSDSNAKTFNVQQVLISSHKKYYTSLIFNEYFASKKMSTITVNQVVYEISDLATAMSSMLPSTVSAVNYEAGTIPNVTVQYNGMDVGTLNITGFAKPTTNDINIQNSDIANAIKQDISNLNGNLNIANLSFPTDSNATSFNVQQVLNSKHQKYYTSLIFNEYFANKKMSTMTVNDIVYQISDLANDMSSMFPKSVTNAEYEAGTISEVTVQYDGMDVGTIDISGFAKPTTNNLQAQAMAITNAIKQDVSSLNGTLDISNLTFPSGSNAKLFNVSTVLNSNHQKYYTSLIFKEYFISKDMNTITVNGIAYQVNDLANAMSSVLPKSVSTTDMKNGTIPGVEVEYDGNNVGTITITGFAKDLFTNQQIANVISQKLSNSTIDPTRTTSSYTLNISKTNLGTVDISDSDANSQISTYVNSLIATDFSNPYTISTASDESVHVTMSDFSHTIKLDPITNTATITITYNNATSTIELTGFTLHSFTAQYLLNHVVADITKNATPSNQSQNVVNAQNELTLKNTPITNQLRVYYAVTSWISAQLSVLGSTDLTFKTTGYQTATVNINNINLPADDFNDSTYTGKDMTFSSTSVVVTLTYSYNGESASTTITFANFEQ